MAGPQAQRPISQSEVASASRVQQQSSYQQNHQLHQTQHHQQQQILLLPQRRQQFAQSSGTLEHIQIDVEDQHGSSNQQHQQLLQRHQPQQHQQLQQQQHQQYQYQHFEEQEQQSQQQYHHQQHQQQDQDDIEQLNEFERDNNNDNSNSNKDKDIEHGRKRSRHKHRRPLYRRVISYIRTAWTGVNFSSSTDSELEELETPPRYRPDSLSALCRVTRFSAPEIKRIYRGFKAECPTGVVKEDTFKIIYSQFFPQGANTGLYAHYVFNTLDRDKTGIVSFEDFVQGLSLLSRGTVEEKLRWTFSLYDINGDGYITREEMTDIVTAIYELVGRHPDAIGPDIDKIKEKVDRIFQKMDLNQDGVVTLDEFLICCQDDDIISRSMSVFDSQF